MYCSIDCRKNSKTNTIFIYEKIYKKFPFTFFHETFPVFEIHPCPKTVFTKRALIFHHTSIFSTYHVHKTADYHRQFFWPPIVRMLFRRIKAFFFWKILHTQQILVSPNFPIFHFLLKNINLGGKRHSWERTSVYSHSISNLPLLSNSKKKQAFFRKKNYFFLLKTQILLVFDKCWYFSLNPGWIFYTLVTKQINPKILQLPDFAWNVQSASKCKETYAAARERFSFHILNVAEDINHL